MSEFITNAELRIEAERLCDENDELRKLVRDFERACGGLCVDCDHANPYYPEEADEICLLTVRAKSMGVM